MTPGMRALRILQYGLLGVGCSMLLLYAGSMLHGNLGRDLALQAFAAEKSQQHALEKNFAARQPPTSIPTDRPDVSDEERPDQSLWSDGRVAAYRAAGSMPSSGTAGVLTIPSIDLRVPIFDGTSEVNLNRGVGRIRGTAKFGEAGNLGIAGHRDGFFRGLKDVSLGDVIDVELQGGSVRYRITAFEIVEPTNVEVLYPTDHRSLTLVTCYPFYFVGDAPQRYIVKATAIQ